MKEKTFSEALEDLNAAWAEFVDAVMEALKEAIAEALAYCKALKRLEEKLKGRKK